MNMAPFTKGTCNFVSETVMYYFIFKLCSTFDDLSFMHLKLCIFNCTMLIVF